MLKDRQHSGRLSKDRQYSGLMKETIQWPKYIKEVIRSRNLKDRQYNGQNISDTNYPLKQDSVLSKEWKKDSFCVLIPVAIWIWDNSNHKQADLRVYWRFPLSPKMKQVKHHITWSCTIWDIT